MSSFVSRPPGLRAISDSDRPLVSHADNVQASAGNRVQADLDNPTAALVHQITEEVSNLARLELQLAKAELSEEGNRVNTALSLTGIAGICALVAAACVAAASGLALATVVEGWAAALIVGGALTALSVVLAFASRRMLG